MSGTRPSAHALHRPITPPPTTITFIGGRRLARAQVPPCSVTAPGARWRWASSRSCLRRRAESWSSSAEARLRGKGGQAQIADLMDSRGLLRPGGERPYGRAAKDRYELAPPHSITAHHSITSSAQTSSQQTMLPRFIRSDDAKFVPSRHFGVMPTRKNEGCSSKWRWPPGQR